MSDTFGKILEYNRENDLKRKSTVERVSKRNSMSQLERIEDTLYNVATTTNMDIQTLILGSTILCDIVPLLANLDRNCATNSQLLDIYKRLSEI